MKNCILTLLFTSLLCFPCHRLTAGIQNAQTEKEKLVFEYFELIGTVKMADDIKKEVLSKYKAQVAGFPDEFWKTLDRKLDMHEFLSQLAKVYARHLTTADLKAAIVFYSSEAGQNLLKNMPLISSEAAAIGEIWSEKISTEVAKQMAAKREP